MSKYFNEFDERLEQLDRKSSEKKKFGKHFGKFDNRNNDRKEFRDRDEKPRKHRDYDDDDDDCDSISRDFSLKDVFESEKLLSKIGKKEMHALVEDNFEKFINKYEKCYRNENGEIPKWMRVALTTKKFVKAFLNQVDPDDEEVDPTINLIISDQYLRNADMFNSEDEDDKKISEKYFEFFARANKDTIKKIAKRLHVDEESAITIALSSVNTDYMSNSSMNYRVYAMLKSVYAAFKDAKDIEDIREKDIYKLLVALYGEERLTNIAVTILLERQSNYENLNDTQKEMWNLLTLTALNIIENCEKDEIKELIKMYAKRRRNKGQVVNIEKKRVSLINGVAEDDYPKIMKIVDKLVDNDESYRQLLG